MKIRESWNKYGGGLIIFAGVLFLVAVIGFFGYRAGYRVARDSPELSGVELAYQHGYEMATSRDQSVETIHFSGTDTTNFSNIKFDPDIHFITDIDTVGWERTGKLIKTEVAWRQHGAVIYQSGIDSIFDSLWSPILDTTYEDKIQGLWTPEEYEKLKMFLAGDIPTDTLWMKAGNEFLYYNPVDSTTW